MFDPERVKKKLCVSDEEFEDNWDIIFKREKKNDSVMKHKRKKHKDLDEER